jgi:hypothetical protein
MTNHFRRGITVQEFGGAVPCGHDTGQRLADDRVAGGLDDGRQVRLGLFGSFPVGNIGGDAADGVGNSISIQQRKLDRDVGVQAIIVLRDFLKFQRSSGRKHAQVIHPKRV